MRKPLSLLKRYDTSERLSRPEGYNRTSLEFRDLATTHRAAALVLVAAAALFVPVTGRAQALPTRPISLADGRLTVGLEVSAAWGSDDTGYFDYTSYETSVLRRVRAGLSVSYRPADWLTLLGEVRSQSGAPIGLYALYARVRPWSSRRFDIQIGRVPPTFGAYSRRSYPQDNPLVGDPLMYQYLTTLRNDAAPSDADELLQKRGRGWLVGYRIGNVYGEAGLPIASIQAWATGLQLRAAFSPVELAASVTSGSLSDPSLGQRLKAPQVTVRAAVSPVVGLVVGVSAESGSFLTTPVVNALPPGTASPSQVQQAVGMDVEYSRGHWIVRGEAILNRWRLPAVDVPAIDRPLDVLGWYAEVRYRLLPQVYVAGRVDHLGFSDLAGSVRTLTWDANVTRTEAGAGYYLQRNVILKASWQHNMRDGGRIRRSDLGAIQLLYWF